MPDGQIAVMHEDGSLIAMATTDTNGYAYFMVTTTQYIIIYEK